MNPALTFVNVDGYKVSLETLRVRFGWPEGGLWDYDLGLNRWRYQYSTGPDTVSITAVTAEPLPAKSRWIGREEALALYPMDNDK